MSIDNPDHSSARDKEEKSGPLRYLALGDSYTIGEGVEERNSFPHLLVGRLLDYSLVFFPPTVIARTGWTTKELQKGMDQAPISNPKYDLVTILVGVNNQYRGDHIETFQVDFSQLLDQALVFADGNPSRVITISIPDWGVTPFAIKEKRNAEKIAEEIDRYNQVIERVSRQKKVLYLEITRDYRDKGGLPGNLVADKLHPSSAVYKNWTEELSRLILSKIDFS